MTGCLMVISALVLVTALYCGMVVFYSLHLFRHRRDLFPGDHSEKPFVSVVIAVRNEEDRIGSCLAGLASQDYPAGRFEVIVSDDFSGDRTAEICRSFFLANPGLRGGVLPPGSGGNGKKAALARAIHTASGEYILATDADTLRGPSWITAMAEEALSSGSVMVLGPVILSGLNTPLEGMQSAEFLGIMGITAGSSEAGIPVMCNGANLMYRRDIFEEFGGYRENERFASGDDHFMMEAARRRYGRFAISFAMDRRAVVTASPQDSIGSFMAQRRRWVSKSTGYRDPAVLVTGAFTYLVNFGLVAGLLAGIFCHAALIATLDAFVLKACIDFLPVYRMAAFFKEMKYLAWFLPAQILQPFYVVLTGILGLVLPYRWKGRVIRV